MNEYRHLQIKTKSKRLSKSVCGNYHVFLSEPSPVTATTLKTNVVLFKKQWISIEEKGPCLGGV